MYVDKYSERLSDDERELAEIAVSKRRKKQRIIFLCLSLAVVVSIVLFLFYLFSIFDDGYIKNLAEAYTDSSIRSDSANRILGFGNEVLGFLAIGITVIAVLCVNIKQNYDYLSAFYVVCVDKYRIISIAENNDKDYPYLLRAQEYGRDKEKEFKIKAETFEMIQDSRDAVIINYPDINLFYSAQKRNSGVFYMFVPKNNYPYEFIKADF